MRRANQPLMTAAEALIGIEHDDPLKAAKRNARYLVANYDFAPLQDRYETVEDGHAGRIYKLYARMTSRVSNDAAVISVFTDGRGAFWGHATEETSLWEPAYGRDAYWIAAKAFVEARQAEKAS